MGKLTYPSDTFPTKYQNSVQMKTTTAFVLLQKNFCKFAHISNVIVSICRRKIHLSATSLRVPPTQIGIFVKQH